MTQFEILVTIGDNFSEKILISSRKVIKWFTHFHITANTFRAKKKHILDMFKLLLDTKNYFEVQKMGEKQHFFMTKFQKHEKENANFQSHELSNKTVLASSYQYHIKVQKNSSSPS